MPSTSCSICLDILFVFIYWIFILQCVMFCLISVISFTILWIFQEWNPQDADGENNLPVLQIYFLWVTFVLSWLKSGFIRDLTLKYKHYNIGYWVWLSWEICFSWPQRLPYMAGHLASDSLHLASEVK